METDSQKKVIRRYLLGDLPEAEQSALTHEFFAEDETFEQVWAMENDLIDGYVRGTLAPVEKDLFEQNYMASPVHRERVAFAKTLIETVDAKEEERTAFVETELSTSWRPSLSAWFQGKGWGWAMAAAVILLAVGSIWLLNERARLREQFAQLKNEKSSEQQHSQELEKEIALEREQNDTLVAEIERLHNEAARIPQTPPPVERPYVMAFILSPMLMRSGGEPQSLKISKATTLILLQMKVADARARNFQATVRTVEGLPIWSKGSINAHLRNQNQPGVAVSLPASKLATGDYILTLSVTTEANEAAELNRYFFRVIKE